MNRIIDVSNVYVVVRHCGYVASGKGAMAILLRLADIPIPMHTLPMYTAKDGGSADALGSTPTGLWEQFIPLSDLHVRMAGFCACSHSHG